MKWLNILKFTTNHEPDQEIGSPCRGRRRTGWDPRRNWAPGQPVAPDLGWAGKRHLSDLGVNRVGQVLAVLGLDGTKPDTQARRKKRGLWMAAKTASVSYSDELAPEVLEQVLAGGDAAGRFAPT